MLNKDLEERARKLRQEIFDISIQQGEPHFGGCFSCVEILVSLYKSILKKEDKFILGAGHKALAWYPLLREKGYNPKITMHPDKDIKNGIEFTTGSLGHGIGIGAGIAHAKKMKKEKGRVYILCGDGEMHEGSCWESLNYAVENNLNNLITVIDYNKLSAISKTKYSLTFIDRLKATGCDFCEIDGHNFDDLEKALNKEYKKPVIILAHTIKGKGVSFMEGDVNFHNKMPTEEEIEKIREELK